MVLQSHKVYKIEHVNSRSVLELDDRNAKQITVAKDADKLGQKWHLVAAGNYWFIRNASSSRYLEHDDPNGKFGRGVPIAAVDRPHLVWDIKAVTQSNQDGDEVYRICHADWSMDIMIPENGQSNASVPSESVLLSNVSRKGDYQFWRFVESS